MKKYQSDLLFFYSFLIIFGTITGEVFNLPIFYLTEKSNLLNQIFVKRGWAWTFILLCFLRVNSPGSRSRSLKKLFSATIYWFLITQWTFGPSLLERIYKYIGSCSLLHLKEFHLCYEGGGEWDGLDISGHCFLLLHSSLLIWEELISSRSYLKYGPVLFCGILLILLLILWAVMLIVTVLYFHSMIEKVLGAVLGFGFWFLF